ncbi:MAG TPA: hypothetical protein VG893_03170 [Terracidiphilus sp.]|nr:hypothetical protein [Terracidiphilus sp.]
MSRERRAILSLVAAGRITPREAERLMMLADDGDDALLRMAVALAALWLALPQMGTMFLGAVHAVTAWIQMGGMR